mmetsp:Transcript_11915/g.31129  ORF Transcript_11915/g.31129 Transcript_11915/m.31129 type:complete len:395 (-) Transcript_11915:471-1655(-)
MRGFGWRARCAATGRTAVRVVRTLPRWPRANARDLSIERIDATWVGLEHSEEQLPVLLEGALGLPRAERAGRAQPRGVWRVECVLVRGGLRRAQRSQVAVAVLGARCVTVCDEQHAHRLSIAAHLQEGEDLDEAPQPRERARPEQHNQLRASRDKHGQEGQLELCVLGGVDTEGVNPQQRLAVALELELVAPGAEREPLVARVVVVRVAHERVDATKARRLRRGELRRERVARGRVRARAHQLQRRVGRHAPEGACGILDDFVYGALLEECGEHGRRRRALATLRQPRLHVLAQVRPEREHTHHGRADAPQVKRPLLRRPATSEHAHHARDRRREPDQQEAATVHPPDQVETRARRETALPERDECACAHQRQARALHHADGEVRAREPARGWV